MLVVHEFERFVPLKGPPSEIKNVDEGGGTGGTDGCGILLGCSVIRLAFLALDEVGKRREESIGKGLEKCQFISSSIFSNLKFFRSCP